MINKQMRRVAMIGIFLVELLPALPSETTEIIHGGSNVIIPATRMVNNDCEIVGNDVIPTMPAIYIEKTS